MIKKYWFKFYYKFLAFKLNYLPRFFVGNLFMSSLYYLLFSSKFRREQHAVLTGKLNHIKLKKSGSANIYTLIRNIHRLEKGLLMKPRRDVFGKDFIRETVNSFEKFYAPNSCSPGTQIKWGFDVLSEYFRVVGDDLVINEQRTRFNAIIAAENELKVNAIPYYRNKDIKPNISYEDFYSLTKFRRSVRWFLDKPVPRDLIDKAILAANQSPSACNRQPFEYRVIDDPMLLKKVANLPMGVKGYVEGIKVFIVVVGNLDAYFDERDRHVIYIDASLANMTFMLALETLGLSSCAINWPDIESLEIQMANILNLKKDQRSIMCMAVGYPDSDGLVAYSEKKELNSLRKYN